MPSRLGDNVRAACTAAAQEIADFAPLFQVLKMIEAKLNHPQCSGLQVASLQVLLLNVRECLDLHERDQPQWVAASDKTSALYESSMGWFRTRTQAPGIMYGKRIAQLSDAVNAWAAKEEQGEITNRRIALVERVLTTNDVFVTDASLTHASASTRKKYLAKAVVAAKACAQVAKPGNVEDAQWAYRTEKFAGLLKELESAHSLVRRQVRMLGTVSTRPRGASRNARTRNATGRWQPAAKRRRAQAAPPTAPAVEPVSAAEPSMPGPMCAPENPLALAHDDAELDAGHWHRLDDPATLNAHLHEAMDDAAPGSPVGRDFRALLSECCSRSPSPEAAPYAVQFRQHLESMAMADTHSTVEAVPRRGLANS